MVNPSSVDVSASAVRQSGRVMLNVVSMVLQSSREFSGREAGVG